MSAHTLIRPSDFDVSKMEYSEPKAMGAGATGAKQVYINYNKNPIILVTPKMRLPYGVGKYEESGKPTKYSLDLSFVGKDSDPKIQAFYDTLKAIDEKIIQDSMSNSLVWLRKKTMSKDVAQTLYTPSIKVPKDKETGEETDKYPHTFKGKISYYNEAFQCSAFDHNKEKIEGDFTDRLVKGQHAAAIVKCAGIWFSGGKFGCSWRIEQLKLDEPKNLVGYAFLDDDEGDGDS